MYMLIFDKSQHFSHNFLFFVFLNNKNNFLPPWQNYF